MKLKRGRAFSLQFHALQQCDDDDGAIIADLATFADAVAFALPVEDRRAGTEGRSWVIERNSRTWFLTMLSRRNIGTVRLGAIRFVFLFLCLKKSALGSHPRSQERERIFEIHFQGN